MSGECKACGDKLASDTKTCPGCGAAVTAKPKLLPLAAFMLIVILVIQAYMNKPEDEAGESNATAPVSSAEQ